MKTRKSPKEIIESNDNPYLEDNWTKRPRKNLKNTSINREDYGVTYRTFLGIKHPLSNMHYQDVHTHVNRGDPMCGVQAYPDIYNFLVDLGQDSSVVAQIDPESREVQGYTIIRKSKAYKDKGFRIRARRESEENIKDLKSKKYFSPNVEDLGQWNKVLDFYKLNHRFVPSKGYVFDKNLGRYIKQEKSIETKVASIIGISSLILSLVFLSSDITGFVIANLTTPASNIVGTSLFLLGILGLFYYFKIKK